MKPRKTYFLYFSRFCGEEQKRPPRPLLLIQGQCYCYILHLGKISEDSLSKVFEVIVCNIFEKYQIPPTLTLKKFFKKFLKSLIFFLRFVYNHTTSKERVRLQCKGQRYRG